MSYIELGINVSNFIDSYRNIGYSMETAITDVIDNSIFAGASKININNLIELWDSFATDNPKTTEIADVRI